MKKIFAVNLGSTSTKVAYYEDENCIFKDSINHDVAEFKECPTVFDQKELRKRTIIRCLAEHSIDLDELDAFVTRGGQTEPVNGGVYKINESYVQQAMSGSYGVHVCSVGSAIALELCEGMKTVAGIASGYSDNLLLRAADVVLKERRKLVLVVRESPFSSIHLRNMLELSQVGAVIFPSMLSYYSKPQTIADVENQLIGKVLDQFGLDYSKIMRWTEGENG